MNLQALLPAGLLQTTLLHGWEGLETSSSDVHGMDSWIKGLITTYFAMRMPEELSLDTLGNLAEIIGAGSILTGLAFGLFQIRQYRAQQRDAIAISLSQTFYNRTTFAIGTGRSEGQLTPATQPCR